MNCKLFDMTKRPALWQRSTAPFWDDEYISQQMLKAHLNPDIDAASRRPEFIERSVKWLSEIIVRGGKILDLGCGPGLYTKRLSAMGYNVTGVDLSKNSIEYARAGDSSTNYICSNYLLLDDTDKYDAITLIYCDYAALTQPERTNLLKKIRNMLKPDGIFVFDVFTPEFYKNKSESKSWYSCGKDEFWSADEHICLEAAYLYENGTVSADKYVVITKDSINEYIVWDTVYTKQSLADELSASGLHPKAFFGDVCGKEYDDSSETLCCIAVKQ